MVARERILRFRGSAAVILLLAVVLVAGIQGRGQYNRRSYRNFCLSPLASRPVNAKVEPQHHRQGYHGHRDSSKRWMHSA